LNEAYNKKNNEKEFIHNSLLPRAESIYEKKYYFMDETLLEREKRLTKKKDETN
jgi:hypothetical protein